MTVSHRSNPPTFTHYRQYKPYVREDFRYCCAYCVSHEAHVGDLWAMTLDHFKPKTHFIKLKNTYTNLYYVCCRCNTYKGSTWPTRAERKKGWRYIDACSDNHADHIEYANGRAVGLTSAGEYSIEHLRLNRRPLLKRRVRLANCVAAEIATLKELEHLSSIQSSATGGSVESVEIASVIRSLRESCVMRLRDLIFPRPLDG